MKIDIIHIAKLANLEVTPDEEKKYKGQLASILDYINKLNEVETNQVEPTSQVTNLENVTKSDETSPSLSQQEEALSNAKKTHNGFFEVEAILAE